MPHIMVFHTLKADLKSLLNGLHEVFSAHDNVNIRQTKTYSIALDHAIVGEADQPEDMIHIQVRMKPGRTDEVKEHLSTVLHDTARAFINENNLVSYISVELHELDGQTYRSSYA